MPPQSSTLSKLKQMILLKLLNRSKGPSISLIGTTIAMIGGVWSFDFQKLFPGTSITSQTIYNLRAGLTQLFLLILIFLLSCVWLYYLVLVIKSKKDFAKDLTDTVKTIKESVENNYKIHQRSTLSPSIDKAMNEEASRGFNLPQGSLAGSLFDIYLNEISVYSLMLHDSTLLLAHHPEIQFTSPEFIHLFQELLIAHNKRIKNFHNRQITDLFSPNSSTLADSMVEHFSNQADVETKLRYKELLASLNIKKLISCDEMVFQSWEPIIREKSKPHIFVEEDKL